MNKEEVLKLARERGLLPEGDSPQHPVERLIDYTELQDELLAFANACEKIGMEKAANENAELRKAAMRVLDSPYAKSGIEFIQAMKQLDSIITGTQANTICEATK